MIVNELRILFVKIVVVRENSISCNEPVCVPLKKPTRGKVQTRRANQNAMSVRMSCQRLGTWWTATKQCQSHTDTPRSNAHKLSADPWSWSASKQQQLYVHHKQSTTIHSHWLVHCLLVSFIHHEVPSFDSTGYVRPP